MWKYRKNWLTGSVNILCPELSLLLFILIFSLTACAPAVQLNPPKTPLQHPARSANLPVSPDFNKGYAEYQKGNQPKARQEFEKILKKSPEYYAADLAISYTYLAEGAPDSAERYVRSALEKAPDYTQAHWILSQILEMKQDYAGAVEELNQVERLDPEYTGLEQTRKILHLKATEQYLTEARKLAESNPAEALQYYEKAEALAPEISQIPLEIAQIYLKRGNCDEGLKYLEKSKEQLPDEPAVLIPYADCLYDLEDYQRALAIYEKVQSIAPDPAVESSLQKTRKRIEFLAMPREYQDISRTGEINRSQLAALMMTNLEFLQKYSSEESIIVVDIFDHWAKSYIRQAVNLGLMEVYPNRTFQPWRAITKLELTRAAYRALQILETGEGKTLPPVDETLQFIPDVSDSNINHTMIVKSISSGAVSLDADGRFHINRTVSGAEAMSMVNRLRVLSE